MPVSPARAAAFDILLRVETQDSYAAELLHSELCAHLSAADQGLATELVMGVLRWQSALDQAIAQVSAQKLQRMDAEVLVALRVGAYQLGWLERIPPHASIHESVELVKRARKRSAAPFANAVLRKLAGSLKTFQPVLAEVMVDAGTIAATLAHPEWLVQTWCAQFGLETAQKICAYDQAVPETAIRLNHMEVEKEVCNHGIQFASGAFLSSARRVVAGDVTKTEAYAEGRVAIQDEASQLIAALVGEGKRILDCCAAPGGKTSAIAERNPAATIIATEKHRHRAELLRKRARASNVTVVHIDILDLPVSEPFDRVLVDVPCSGTGTLARNPEIKWRLKPEDLIDLPMRQAAILQAALQHVAAGGRLIYSTCSLQQDEDEDVVERTLRENPKFRLGNLQGQLEDLQMRGELVMRPYDSLLSGPFLRTIPGVHLCDGFFAALLERTE
jgi:16S rRNA (cytosine967-C5)-methyltransferase